MNIENERETAIFYITNNGLLLAQRLKKLYPDAGVLRFKSEAVSKLWSEYKNLIFIMATGIVVRSIATLIKNKKTDPAVVVMDEKGKFVISLLSGHLGGANKRAKEIAKYLGGEAVITTASDINNLTSIDLWAKDNNLVVENPDVLPKITTRFLNSRVLRLHSDVDIELPEEFQKTNNPEVADILITNKQKIDCDVIPVQTGIQKKRIKELDSYRSLPSKVVVGGRNDKGQIAYQLYLRPKNLTIGIGCNSKTPADEIENAVRKTLKENNLSFLSIRSIATIDKKINEPGLIAFTRKYSFEIMTFNYEELNKVKNIKKSQPAFKATGANAVAEPAALLGCESQRLAAGSKSLLVQKQKIGNVTVAVAERQSAISNQQLPPHPPLSKGGLKGGGKLYIVGIGPGGIDHITPCAQQAIKESDVIVGYGTYLGLIQKLIKDKEVISTGMTQEIDRCRRAIEIASEGRTVSIISGGDPGIYAMAGLVLEILRVKGSKGQSIKGSDTLTLEHSDTISVKVVPGISALNACAARLGAPLMHDLATISLSDRLTPWKLIEKRLEAAAKADFVIVLYNPKSRGRIEHIGRARKIILKHRTPGTPVGIVKGAMREDERITITNLKEMLDHEIDMQTTVIIGNSTTFVWNDLMITPRGYEKKLKV